MRKREIKKSAPSNSFSKVFKLPIGTLEIRKCGNLYAQAADQPTKGDQSFVELEFIAPKWLTPTGFTATLVGRFWSDLSPKLTASLTPFTINTNPELLIALEDGDFATVQRLFETREANPTDHVIIFNSRMPLLDVRES